MLKLDGDDSMEKATGTKTNGCEEDSWLNGKEETSRPNDVVQMTYRDALMKSEHMAHSIRFTKKLV